jgi:hypothetical protein
VYQFLLRQRGYQFRELLAENVRILGALRRRNRAEKT